MKESYMKKDVVVLGIALFASTFAACSSPERKEEKAAAKVEAATENVCAEIAALRDALLKYGEINADSSLAEVKSATAEVERSWSRLGALLEKLDKAEAKATTAAYNQFRSTVQAIPDSATLGEASVRVAAAHADLVSKQDALSKVQCP
jgi:hypothetical protein